MFLGITNHTRSHLDVDSREEVEEEEVTLGQNLLFKYRRVKMQRLPN